VWETQHIGTSPLEVSPTQKTASLPPTAEASETPRAGKGATTGRIPPGVQMDSTGHPPPREWQVPRWTGRPNRRREPFVLPLTNRFSQLPETEPAGKSIWTSEGS